jgi:hypothetical protein
MVCSHCGQQNPDNYQFCASCGARLTASGPPAQSPAALTTSPPATTPLRIQPVERPAPRADRASRDLRYLLEDDEPQKSLIAPVIVVISLLALAAFGWFELRPLLQSDGATPSKTTTSTPADNGSKTSAESSQPAQTSPRAEAAQTSTQTAPPSQAADDAATPSSADVAKPPPNHVLPAPTIDETQKREPRSSAPALDASVEAPARSRILPKRTPTPVKPAPRPSAPDTVKQAEGYLYGRGVPQDCERALSMLKGEAGKSNPRARSTLGSMYASGHCVSRDLPTAYRYFALVLRTDPENAAASQNLERLWKQMTPPERQTAIKQ